MPRKICNQLGCNILISMDKRYCDLHVKDITKQKNDSYDKKRRNKTHASFYHSKEWKTMRNDVMAEAGGLCKQCTESGLIVNADVVDHIIPIENDYSLRLEVENLQPLCHQCHNKKTAQDMKQ